MLFKRFSLLVILSLVTGCAATPESKDYTAFHNSDPQSILIVPVINHSAEVEAANLFLTTLALPLAERGFYVFPTNMVKDMIEEDGLSDPYLVHTADTPQVAQLFGADSILYVEVLDWRSQYAVVSSGIVVQFLYTLKDGRSGDLLWQEQREFVYQNSGGSGNIFADLIATAITAAIDSSRSDYTPVAMAANSQALLIPGQGIPYGPHSPDRSKNESEFPASGNGKLSNATDIAAALGGPAPTTASTPTSEEQSTTSDGSVDEANGQTEDEDLTDETPTEN